MRRAAARTAARYRTVVSAKQKTDWNAVRRERDALLHPVSVAAATMARGMALDVETTATH